MGGGALITLEGGEGAGKTTQAGRLAAWLTAQGLQVARVREPGGTPVAERLRALLLDPQLEALTPIGEALLFAASRAQAVSGVIRPALAIGAVVLCDRFVDSSLAYQGYGLGVDLPFIEQVNAAATGGLQPDLTILLDIPPALGGRRSGVGQADRIEARGQEFHARVRSGYLALAAASPQRIRVVDAAGGAEDVQATLRGLVAERLGAKGMRLDGRGPP